MDTRKKAVVAKHLLKLARELVAEDGDDDEVDEAFTQKVRGLRQNMTKLGPKKRKPLKNFGIGMIRPNMKVEDLIDALAKVVEA